MSSVFSIAASGLAAQSKRLEVTAANVANQRSVAPRPGAQPQAGEYVPHQVALSSRAGGGVEAKAVPVSPPSVLVYEPGAPDADADGIVARPNVDLATELVNLLDARRNFQANLKVIQAEDRRLGDLLDVIS